MEQAVRADDARRLPPAEPAVPRPAGRVRRQPQAGRDLPQAGQGTRAVPPAQPGRQHGAASVGCRAPRRSSRPSPRATPRRPARRCSTTSWKASSARSAAPGLMLRCAPGRAGADRRPDDRSQRPALRAAEAAHRRRLRRRLRARLHRAGGRRRAHAVDEALAGRGHRAGRPTAWCRASPTRTTCRSSPARRPRCTASAATTSSTPPAAPR
jgi:hypothetical protein